ncbi:MULTISPECIES: heavy metal translocating P-type ATPase [Massilia]|uniref:P-type Zn(2+) transporter n=1 Tax=Massilia timonae TaxID=47229 RepID=A0A1S2NFS4_9BURK|nr:cadmium-translocating P-type ATPase [Massilia timonae]
MSDCNSKSCCQPKPPARTIPIAPTGPVIRIIPAELDEPNVQAVPDVAASDARQMTVHIAQMCCPTEERVLRSSLGKLAGVEQLDFNLMQRELRIIHTMADPAPILDTIRALAMVPVMAPAGTQRTAAMTETAATPSGATAAPAPGAAQTPAASSRAPFLRLSLGLVAAIGAEAWAWATGNDGAWPVFALAVIAIALTGLGVYRKGWAALRHRDLNINALMSIAVTGAVLIGHWPEAAMVMVLFALAEQIEARALDRARNAIQGLMALTPERVTVRDADGQWRERAAAGVTVGTLARVAPGERVALDGEVTAGESSVNQAPITGESMPVPKGAGDRVFAGSINESGSFEYRVTAAHDDSTLARIIRTVQEAQGKRAPTQRFIDRFAAVYTPIVFVVALLVALLPPLLMGGAWDDWIYKALVLLVIACPCALVISTPVTVVSGLARAARAGILVKGGVYLEQGASLRSVALDKTGTVTQGRPALTDMVPLNGDGDEALRLAAALASRSDHPVSTAISRHWQEQREAQVLPEVDDFAALPGRGTQGRVAGAIYSLGNARLLAELGSVDVEAARAIERLEGEGKTAVALCAGARVLAVIGVADTIRATSVQAVERLHRLGIRTVMLSGDNVVATAAIARQVGIDDARGGLLPEEKLAAVEAEVARHGMVGMVGDGINDAPALARASIGFAMGAAGTDTAIETADVALLDDDLRKLPEFVVLSRRTFAVLRQNIAAALLIKAVFLVLAIGGWATLWMAVFADVGASLLVIFNGLRLLRAELHERSI